MVLQGRQRIWAIYSISHINSFTNVSRKFISCIKKKSTKCLNRNHTGLHGG